MSIHVADWVWHHSIHKGTALLLMLAIADHAHDDGGGAYPSIDALAQKIRMSPRQVKRVVQQLVVSGELEVDENAGPRGCHIYRITMRPGSPPPEGDNLSPPSDDSGPGGHPGATTVTQGQDVPECHGDMGGTGGGHPGQGGVTSETPGGDIAMSPEPSVTVIEPSEPSRATTRVPAREQRALFEDGGKTFDEGSGPTPEPPSPDPQPPPLEVLPEPPPPRWYGLLSGLNGFRWPLANAGEWLREKGITDDQADRAADALLANPKRDKYKDLAAAFRSFALNRKKWDDERAAPPRANKGPTWRGGTSEERVERYRQQAERERESPSRGQAVMR